MRPGRLPTAWLTGRPVVGRPRLTDQRESIMTQLAASYHHCQQIARRTAKKFYYSFLALPRPRRLAMCALYAFLRHTDDLGDNPSPLAERRRAVAAWRKSLESALAGEFDDPLFPALADTVQTYQIPHEYLFAVLDGIEMDLDERHYETFAELEEYCYRVASVVGLACIHIWGFRSQEALEPARQCGIALQLTNILRDVKEDSDAGRVYLPAEDLQRFDYSPDDLRAGVFDDRCRSLIQFEIARAKEYYAGAEQLRQWLEPVGLPVFDTMVGIYRALLDEIERREGNVFAGRVSLSGWRKLRIAAGSWLRQPKFRKLTLGAGP